MKDKKGKKIRNQLSSIKTILMKENYIKKK